MAWQGQEDGMNSTMTVAGDAPETRLVEMVFPERANHYGTLFGGEALSLLGKAAFIAASRRARRNVVMAASSEVVFHEPVRVGDVLELTARVQRIGRSSMTVAVDGVAESLLSGSRRHAMQASFEMVAVNEAGRPIRIEPSHNLQTPEEILP
jgi:acyl-CoA hydrolase